MLELEWTTPAEWVSAVERDPLALLSDHAHCEIQAAASAQATIVKNPSQRRLVEELAAVAVEELEHFARVTTLLHARGGELQHAFANPYVEALIAAAAPTRDDPLLDRLLVAELIEARSLERFRLLDEHLADRELAALYHGLKGSEAAHRALFARLARELFEGERVLRRERDLVRLEAQAIASLPFDYRMHSGSPGGG